jgi:hypothetical protein
MAATHYETLKVARDAPIEVIRAAYRALSQKYHPDRHPGDAAAAQSMAVLNAAYDVLSDPDKRRQYDDLISSIESEGVFEEVAAPRAHPAWASRKMPAGTMEEPRAVRIFTNWKLYAALIVLGSVGFLVWAAAPALHRHEIELPQPTTITPYVFQDPTLPQAAPGPGTPQSQVPYTAADEPESLSRAPAPPPSRDAKHAKAAPASPATMPSASAPARPPPGEKKAAPAPKDETAPAPVKPKRKMQANAAPGFVEGHYTRPALAPSGMSWPASSDYVGGFQQLNTDGMSQVILDNSQNDFDVFVKVIYLADGEPEPVRLVFLSARDRFTVANLRPGTYDLRYQNLDRGTLLRSGVFALEESAIAGGTRHSTVSIVLHDSADDSTNTYLLSERDF